MESNLIICGSCGSSACAWWGASCVNLLGGRLEGKLGFN